MERARDNIGSLLAVRTEQIKGLVETGRYEKMCDRILKKCAQLTKEYPNLPLSFDLNPRKKGQEASYSVMNSNGMLDVSLRLGNEEISLRYVPDSDILECYGGSFSPRFKHLLTQVEQHLNGVDIEETKEFKNIKQLEETAESIFSELQENPEVKYENDKVRKEETYSFQGILEEMPALIGGHLRGYINPSNIDAIIQQLDTSTVLHFAKEPDEFYSKSSRFIISCMKSAMGFSLSVQTSDRRTSHVFSDTKVRFSYDWVMIGDVVVKEGGNYPPANEIHHHLHSFNGNDALEKALKTFEMYKIDPTHPNSPLLDKDSGYLQIGEDGKSIQITAGAVKEIDRMIEELKEGSVDGRADRRLYSEQLIRLKSKIEEKIKNGEIKREFQEGELPREVLANNLEAPAVSIDDLISSMDEDTHQSSSDT